MPSMPSTVDEYIAAFPPPIRAILRRVRSAVRRAAPRASEGISYRMPAYRENGVLVYFAAFKDHVGFYPPIRGDARLGKLAAPYAGPKGNLKFPYAEPIPYALIERLTKLRVKQNAAKARPRKQRG